MENYIAIVGNADNRITKYQDGTEECCNAHVSAHGGFVCETPDGPFKYWVVDADKKTLSYDKTTHDSDVAAAAAVAYKAARAEAYDLIGDQLDQLFHDMANDKGDKSGDWYKAVAKVKSDNPKPE